jgi:hypothetical protein
MPSTAAQVTVMLPLETGDRLVMTTCQLVWESGTPWPFTGSPGDPDMDQQAEDVGLAGHVGGVEADGVGAGRARERPGEQTRDLVAVGGAGEGGSGRQPGRQQEAGGEQSALLATTLKERA